MKKRSKKILGLFGMIFTLGVLTSCNSFCSVKDNAAYRYSYDPINTIFFENEEDAVNYVYNALAKENETVYFSNSNVKDLEVTKENVKNYKVNVYNEDETVVEENLISKATFFTNDNFSNLTAGKASLDEIYFVRTSSILTYTKGEEDKKTEYIFETSKNSLIQNVEANAAAKGINKPSDQFWTDLDKKVISKISLEAKNSNYFEGKNYSSAFELLYGYTSKAYNDYIKDKTTEDLKIMLNGGTYTYQDGTSEVILGRNNSLLANFGSYKFLEEKTQNDLGMGTGDYWHNIKNWNYEIQKERNASGYNMNQDYINIYTSALDTKVVALKSCFTLDEGFYGHTNENLLDDTVLLTNKSSWGEAWAHGWLEGLLVYPIAYLVEYFSHTFGMNGWGQIGAVLLVTVIVRLFFMLITFGSTLSQQKMQMLQPEIAKLQQKYPNSNSNQYEKQRLAQAQMALYKKHKVHPFSSLLVMFIQFPLFIAVWNGMSGAASLSVDAVLGLRLSDTIWSVLINFQGWPGNPGWWTALILILLMSAGQVVSMKLPQWLQKSKMKQVEKLGKSQAETDSQKQMKMVSWIMTIFVIIMGFTLPAAMGVYWFAGALFSILQSTILHFVLGNKKSKERK